MQAQERAEDLAARIARGAPTTAHEEDRFVAAARRLDLEVSTFIAEVVPEVRGPLDPSIVVALQLVNTATDITRRTVDRMIEARSPHGTDEPGSTGAAGP